MKKALVAFLAAGLSVVGLSEETDDLAGIATNSVKEKTFTELPLCRRIEGRAWVRKPGAEWTEAEEGRFYPLGTVYRADKASRLELRFGVNITALLDAGAELGTRSQEIGCPSRTVVLMGGQVTLKVPSNLPDGRFFVSVPGFTVKNPAGESRFTYEKRGDGDAAVIRCKTGSLGVEGRHFDIPAMHAANELHIRTSHDQLVTVLKGAGGDYVVNLDQGLRARDEFDDEGKLKQVIEKGSFEWHLTAGTKVIINRAVPSVGERMSVHTMVFDAAGERKSECYYCEGRSEINSGELVVKGKMTAEEIAKRAAEVAETTKAASDVEETTVEESDSAAEETTEEAE